MFYYFARYALDTDPCISKRLRNAFPDALMHPRRLKLKDEGPACHLLLCVPLRDAEAIAIFIFVPHFHLVSVFHCLCRCYYL